MCDVETFEVVNCAVELANKYQVGVQGVIASFISARDELDDDNLAKEFVENETKEMRRIM